MDGSVTDDPQLEKFEEAFIERHIPVIIYAIIVNVFGMLGNIATTIYYGRIARARKAPTQLFVTAISINDFITSVLSLVGTLVALEPLGFFKDALICQGNVVVLKALVTISFVILVLIGFDRYFRVCWPLSKLNFTLKKAKYCLIIGTMSSFIFAAREFATYDIVKRNTTIGDNRTIIVDACIPSDAIDSAGFFLFSQILDWFSLGATTIVLIVLYTLIVWKIVNHTRLTRKESIRAGKQPHDVGNKGNVESSVDNMSTSGTEVKLDSDIKSEVNKAEEPIDDSMNLGNSPAFADSDRKLNENKDMKLDELSLNVNTSKPNSTSKNVTKLRDSTHKVTWTMFIITAASLLSFVPYLILVLVYPHDKEQGAGIMIVSRSFMLNSTINPYVIGFMDRNFRRFLRKGLSNCWHFLRQGVFRCR